MPDLSCLIVDGKALTVKTVALLVNFQQGATIKDARHTIARNDLIGRINLECVPIADPEIKLAIFRSGARGGLHQLRFGLLTKWGECAGKERRTKKYEA
jgi:hypothetical protein